jgi:hypothetical protein
VSVRRQRDWQKTDPHLRSHPAFVKFQRRLGCSATVAHGILTGLWSFAFRFAQDGDISRFSPEDLELALEWDVDGPRVMTALEGTFLKKGVIHDWEEWGGALFAKRKGDAERQWDSREARKKRNESEQEEVSHDVTDSHTMSCDPLSLISLSSSSQDQPETNEELVELEGEIVRDDPFEDLFWPAWPNKHGSKKTAKARFAAASKVQQQRILIAEGFLIATIADGRYEMQYLPRAENFIGGQKSFYEEWADGPPAKYCRGNGNGSKKQRESDEQLSRVLASMDWPEEDS